jgi:hypothetical protein
MMSQEGFCELMDNQTADMKVTFGEITLLLQGVRLAQKFFIETTSKLIDDKNLTKEQLLDGLTFARDSLKTSKKLETMLVELGMPIAEAAMGEIGKETYTQAASDMSPALDYFRMPKAFPAPKTESN